MYKIEVDKILTHQNNIKINRYGGHQSVKLKMYTQEIDYQLNMINFSDNIKDLKNNDNAISINVIFKFAIPKSLSKKEKLKRAGKNHTLKPDLTNVYKAFEDILYRNLGIDDSRNFNIKISKYWNDDADDEKSYILFDIN